MDERLRAIERTHGVFLRREAADCGYDDRAVRTALRLRLWNRVRHGAYCFADTWEAADAVQRHWILARAVMRSLGPRVALSHTSALVAHGIPVWGADLPHVHVTRLDGESGRTTRDVVHHGGELGDDDLQQISGHHATRPCRSVLDAGTVLHVESALVSADAALHLELVDSDELEVMRCRMERWPGAQKLQLVVRLADARAASPGESRSRYLFWTQNLPAPQLQFHVYDEHGALIGITDFAWPEHGVLGEFDGRVKYGRLLAPGQHPGDAVFEEKRREDRLREVTQWRMGRLVWEDLAHPVVTGARFARLLRLAA
jgi:hypothetical protein